MNEHALSVLEFGKVLEFVAEKASSPLGREAILRRRPTGDLDAARDELARVTEMVALFDGATWGFPPIPDARRALRRLSVEGQVLDPSDLYAVGVLLSSARNLTDELERRCPGRGGRLDGVRDLLFPEARIEREILATVDPEGTVLDGASKELARIRGRLRRARTKLVQRLEDFIGSLPDRFVVPDASVTIRDGRYVIAIRREGKGEVGGVIHDQSSTGGTVFVEPPLAIELMNDLKELEREEATEVQRILRDATGDLRPLTARLEGSLAALVDLDTLHARARVALGWGAATPNLTGNRGAALRILGGRHPLLIHREEHVVPFDLELGEERCVIVSGPNTGGKSVFLKAMGLISALAQAGFLPPVDEGTELPVFSNVFADIGDEQSIAASLSTFSAHLGNLAEILREADGESLVLIDEMGTGTDPVEGAALARAILEALVERGALVLVTSHLGALKTLDEDGSRIVNASLQFDPDRMEPTFRFKKGRPGRSYGLAIARRLGFPEGVLDRADEHVSSGEASVDELLERLERTDRETQELLRSLTEETERAARLRTETEERARELRDRERGLEARAREDARRLLLDARQEVEEAIRDVRESRERESLEESARQARRRVETAAQASMAAGTRESAARDGRSGTAGDALAAGQRVRVRGSGTVARVLTVEEDRAVLDASGIRIEVHVGELEPVGGPTDAVGVAATSKRATASSKHPTAGENRATGGSKPSVGSGRGWVDSGVEPHHEVDLRGLRVDEVELELGRALDAAIYGELAELRIIHGKGTGAVRARVEELLRLDRRVSTFRLGVRGEGGAGVTVATVG